MTAPDDTVLLTGATGFVGRSLLPALLLAGARVRCGTRDPAVAKPVQGATFVRVDVNDRGSLREAMTGSRCAYYLVHAMADGKGYETRERAAAHAFADVASECGVERIVYLGGVAPRGRTSRHLQSRLATGEILRAGAVPVFELRAGMIIGHGSISWKIVRDLAARLPAMILPRWLSSLSQPVAIADVVYALKLAMTMPLASAGVYDLPGPETMSAKEILVRIARLRGTRPIMLSVPILSPRLSSYWLKLVSGADYQIARELVLGLSADLIASERELWDVTPGYQRVSFDDAARSAMANEPP